MVIQSAVVPVAGLGTRLLPATKSQPKEMLPVARKPIVQYVVEELVSNGIQQILFVTGRSKSAIENHFDHDPELFQALTQSNKQDLLRELEFEALKANFFYTRQRLQRGLGDAILCAENLAIAGRYIFSPLLFDMIRRVKPDARGEIQLTDAIQFLCEEGRRVIGVKLTPQEKRYDIGNFPSYFESFVEFALADPQYGADFRRVLERLLAKSAVTV